MASTQSAGESPTDSVAVLIQRCNGGDARQGRIVELYFFGRLSFDEISDVLELGLRTVKQDGARAWLRSELKNGA
jgi:DNA-directed RNA polymerase specialized sigma24 family protein